jgi:hypothetical protein
VKSKKKKCDTLTLVAIWIAKMKSLILKCQVFGFLHIPTFQRNQSNTSKGVDEERRKGNKAEMFVSVQPQETEGRSYCTQHTLIKAGEASLSSSLWSDATSSIALAFSLTLLCCPAKASKTQRPRFAVREELCRNSFSWCIVLMAVGIMTFMTVIRKEKSEKEGKQ